MKKLIAILILLITIPLYAIAEENFSVGKKDRNGTLGKDGRSARQAWINNIFFEGITSDQFETLLKAVDPTADNILWLPDSSGVLITNSGGEEMFDITLVSPVINGTVSGGAIYTAPTFTSPVINSPTINDGTDAQMYVVNASGVMMTVAVTLTGDLSGTMPNTGTLNGQIVANAVTNTELDNIDDYTVNNLTVSALTNQAVVFINSASKLVEDIAGFFYDSVAKLLTITNLFVKGSSGPYGEMYFHSHTSPLVITLASGGAWANVTSLTNGVFSDGMTLNSTDGSVTVTYGGVYSLNSSISLQDPDGNSEEYDGGIAVNGVSQDKCSWDRDVTNLSKEGVATAACLLDLTADDVVTMIINSVGGDDAAFETLNWYLKR